MAQPDLQVLSAHMQGAANQLSLVPNMPVINQGTQLLDQIQQLRIQMQQFQQEMHGQVQQMQGQVQQVQGQVQQIQGQVREIQGQVQEVRNEMRDGFRGVNDRIDLMETKNQVRDKNNQARVYNSIINNSEVRLSPLVKINNEAVANFPRDMKTLGLLRVTEVTALLDDYGLDNTGSAADKMLRLRIFIGIVAQSS